ncbi:hypothetical protein QYF36_020827 [Acer negundo]|nr:hypothetical protein QYF36_014245 [Acer negundo]KAK4852070.1 hypothetical protein QYF36_020827 [Acer negundo]
MSFDLLSLFQVPAFSGFTGFGNGDVAMLPVMYPAAFLGSTPWDNQQQMNNRGAGIYADPVHPYTGIPSNALIPLTYNIPTMPKRSHKAITLPRYTVFHIERIPVLHAILILIAANTFMISRPSTEGGAASPEHEQAEQQQQNQQQQPAHQRQAVFRRIQIAFQLDLLLILKLAVVIFLFNLDGSRLRLIFLVFFASLIYL